MDREKIANSLLKLAWLMTEEEEEVDPKFVEKVRELKKSLPRITSRKKRKLRQYNIGVIKGSNTVEDLVNALMMVVNG
jgi:hypothetical protein